MVKLIIFDLDGTLLNTSRTIHTVLNKSLEKFDLPQLSLEKTLTFVGDGARKLVERAVPSGNVALIDEVSRSFSEIYAESDNLLTELYDGEEETLSKLTAAGVRLAVVTNKPQRATERVCKKFLGGVKFDFIFGDNGIRPLKPEPSSVLEIINKLQFKKEECVFIGDGEADVKTAEAAGINHISVLWGFRTKAELEQAGARNFADTFYGLYKILSAD